MWLEECMNDLYDCGVTDSNLALIYEANKNNKVSVVTPNGQTERITINNIVMQGEVFGPLECSVSVDTFGKECLSKDIYLYSYKGVKIPPLAMIDDLLCISTCGLETVKLNAYINAKTKLKKLQFGPDKCHKMHFGRKTDCCPALFVDSWSDCPGEDDIFMGQTSMTDSTEEKYLGDIISADGSNKKNIENRRNKAYGIVKSIMTMLEEIPFGPNYFEMAKLFRNSLFLSSILLNCEAWYGLTMKDIEIFENLDTMLLKKIFETPKSTPNVSVYLELGCIPIRFIIKNRRLMFLHYLLQQDADSLLSKFFVAQYEKPTKGDWWFDVKKDLIDLELEMSLEEIKRMSKNSFKRRIKSAVEKVSLKYLNNKKFEKTKLKDLCYEDLKMQEYLKSSDLKISERKLLFQLRTRMIDVKENFKHAYPDHVCPLCGCENDSQQHLLYCTAISTDSTFMIDPNVRYSDIFSNDVRKQGLITRLFQSQLKKRKSLQNKAKSQSQVTQVI